MPLTVGGGIRTLDDIRNLLKAGADKVSVNTAAVKDPEFVKRASERFGSQCIVVAIDAKKVQSSKFKIISKLPKDLNKLNYYLNESLDNLNIKQLYAYLFHNFESFKNNHAAIKQLEQFKRKELIRKIGFSLYYPSELDYLFKNNISFDLVQVPYNILDQRFASYFPKLKKRG